jgi:hypothetical protein
MSFTFGAPQTATTGSFTAFGSKTSTTQPSQPTFGVGTSNFPTQSKLSSTFGSTQQSAPQTSTFTGFNPSFQPASTATATSFGGFNTASSSGSLNFSPLTCNSKLYF